MINAHIQTMGNKENNHKKIYYQSITTTHVRFHK